MSLLEELNITDEMIVNDFRHEYPHCDFLLIRSRRQDIGIAKCNWGVDNGYLEFKQVEIDEQETQWRYYWTEKAEKEFSDKK